jgi:hypothetical protein
MKKNDNSQTWIVVNLMTCTSNGLFDQLQFVSGKVIGSAFAKEGRKHESNIRVGLDVSEKNMNE